ncbi:MAG: hypothetical protein R2867_17195 [Caldilineaceae bacterium]
MNIAIFGLGYVGCVTTACLARNGHRVIGVDIQPDKVKAIQQGETPIIEPGLAELMRGVHQGRISRHHRHHPCTPTGGHRNYLCRHALAQQRRCRHQLCRKGLP